MGRVTETVQTINHTLRTLLLVVLIGAAGYGGYLAYGLYHQPHQELAEKQSELDGALAGLQQAHAELEARAEEIGGLNQRLEDAVARADRLDIALRLLKVHRRIARLSVLDQRENAETGRDVTRVEFAEINDAGTPIGVPKQFDIDGNVVYLDYFRVTFDDQYVEQSDLDRSTAICLFHRIFGERQQPADGYQLDRVGTRPTAYARGSDMSDFEKKIWDDFWSIANDPRRAEELGIRAAHKVALGMQLEPKKSYQIEIRATGDMTIEPIDSE
jgi:hypothetical protein